MIKCPFCASDNLKKIRKIISPLNKREYTHWYCKSCELEFFTPLEFDPSTYVEEKFEGYKYFHIGRNEIPEWTKNVISVLKNKLNINNLSNKRILEIGAGDGINFIAFKEHFNIDKNNYYVIELDKKSVEICKKRGIKNIYTEYFNKDIIDKIDGKFDVILAFEVLEHQTNPRDFLDTCFKLLKDNGLLIITVPNREMSFHKFKEIPGDIPPHHFLRFNKKFFIKNFTNQVIYVGVHRFKNKTLKETSKVLSKLFFKNSNFWLFFFPLSLIIRVFDTIKGENLIVIIKK